MKEDKSGEEEKNGSAKEGRLADKAAATREVPLKRR